jgi:hypothetical protein
VPQVRILPRALKSLVVVRGPEIAGTDDAAGAANDGQEHRFFWSLVVVAGAVLAAFGVYELFDLELFGVANNELSTANAAAGSRAIKCGLISVAMFPILLGFVRLSRGRPHRLRLAGACAIILTQIALFAVLVIEARASVPPCVTLVCEDPRLL